MNSWFESPIDSNFLLSYPWCRRLHLLVPQLVPLDLGNRRELARSNEKTYGWSFGLRGPFFLVGDLRLFGLIIRCSRARIPRGLLRAPEAGSTPPLDPIDGTQIVGAGDGSGEIGEPSFEILNSGATQPLPVRRPRPVPARTPIREIRTRVLDRQVPAPGTKLRGASALVNAGFGSKPSCQGRACAN